MSAMDQELSENVWFVWSKHHTVETSPHGTDGRTDGRTREDNVTQPLAVGGLSFALCWKIQMTHCQPM